MLLSCSTCHLDVTAGMLSLQLFNAIAGGRTAYPKLYAGRSGLKCAFTKPPPPPLLPCTWKCPNGLVFFFTPAGGDIFSSC